jgi:hypothetical protein
MTNDDKQLRRFVRSGKVVLENRFSALERHETGENKKENSCFLIFRSFRVFRGQNFRFSDRFQKLRLI